MIYFLSGLVLLSPLLFTLLLTSDLPGPLKVWVGLGGLALLVVVPIVVFLVYGGGSIIGAMTGSRALTC